MINSAEPLGMTLKLFEILVHLCLLHCRIWGHARRLSKTKNTRPMTVSMETVRVAKSRPGKNQSQRSDLPQAYLDM
jgi:hypothetical protein